MFAIVDVATVFRLLFLVSANTVLALPVSTPCPLAGKNKSVPLVPGVPN